MKNKKLIRIVITDRDYELFQYLFENKIATVNQIQRDIFHTCNKQATSRRLLKLKRKGLIVSYLIKRDEQICLTYSLNDKGLKFASERLPELVDNNVVKSDSKDHDLDIVDLKHCLRKYSIVNKIHSESALKRYKYLQEEDDYFDFISLNSDSVFELSVNRKLLNVAFEYDRTQKSNSRYLKKINDYYDSESILAVLYVCRTRSNLKNLMNVDKKLRKQDESKFYFALQEDVLSSEEKVTFQNFKGQKFKIF